MIINILGVVCIIGCLITFYRFAGVTLQRRRASMKFKEIIGDSTGEVNKNYMTLDKMRLLNDRINSVESNKLLSAAEESSTLFVRRLREFLFFMILLIILVTLTE